MFLNFHSDSVSAKNAREQIESLGAHCTLIQGDVGTPQGSRAVVSAVAAQVGQLDQLVHCAVRVVPAPILDIDLQELTDAINLNGTALVYLVQAAKSLLKRDSTVLFLSSRGSRQPLPQYAALGAAKSLAESLIRYLVIELAPLGVRINSVSPSAVDTEGLRQVYGAATKAVLEQSAKDNPSGRNVEHDDYCSLIEYLASPAAAMIQGQVIFVNGGAYLSA